MTGKLKRVLLTVAAMAFVAAPALAFSSVAVADSPPDINSSLCAGTSLNLNSPSQNCNDGTSVSNLQGLLTTVINIFSVVVGVIAVIMIIVGGLQYITSGGDSGKVGKAKTTIIYALVGLVVVALAQLIVHFVLAQTTSIISGGA